MKSEGENPVREEYGKLAPVYDRRWSYYTEATARETVARIRFKPGESLLDVACGTGVLLALVGRLYPGGGPAGVDLSAPMLAVARRRLPPSVPLRAGNVESLPFDDQSYDVVVCCSAFHYFRHPGLALAEMKRVLKPGGRIVITDWCDDYLACRVLDRFLRRFNRAHFRAYRSGECARLLEEAGFRGVRVECFKINWLWALMTATGGKEGG